MSVSISSTTDRLIWWVALWEEGFGDVESKGERLDRTCKLEWISVAKNIPRIGQIRFADGKWSVGTYARPQDYALDPQPDEGEKRPECEMNAEEESVFMMRTTYLIVNL